MAPGGCVCTSISSGELPSITTIPHLQRVAGVGLGDDDRSLFPPLSIRLKFNPRFRGISYGQADKVLKFRTGDQVGTGVTGVRALCMGPLTRCFRQPANSVLREAVQRVRAAPYWPLLNRQSE